MHDAEEQGRANAEGYEDQAQHAENEPGGAAAHLVSRLRDAEGVDEGIGECFQKAHASMIGSIGKGLMGRRNPGNSCGIQSQVFREGLPLEPPKIRLEKEMSAGGKFRRIPKENETMATAAVTPTVEVVNAPAPPSSPVVLTPSAIVKVKEIMATQDPIPAGLRIGVVGGGCSGFQYSMSFENAAGMMDKVVRFEDLKVFVDATSAMYLNGCTVDYVETLEAAGFKFENPQVKSTCGCGSSFSV
jgi:iron-sulfur cluster assembly accessory protein